MLIRKYFPYFLFIYHLIFAFIGYDYISDNSGDATRYWFQDKNISTTSWMDYFNPGTDVIKFITYPLVKYFHLPFFAGFIIFSLFSYIGFYLLWRLFENACKESFFVLGLVMVLLLLPNVHFWTSLIGKEAFLFPFVVIFIKSLYEKNFQNWLLWFSLLMIGLVRPHIAILFLIVALIYFLLSVTMNKRSYLKLISILILITGVIAYSLIIVGKIEGNPFERIGQLYEAHNYYLKRTATYVPLEKYTLGYKLFTFYFRPYPWETSGFYFQIVCWENMVLLVLTLISIGLIILNFKKVKRNSFFWMMFVLLFLYGALYVFAYANIGLIIRTKALLIPALYCFISISFSTLTTKPVVAT